MTKFKKLKDLENTSPEFRKNMMLIAREIVPQAINNLRKAGIIKGKDLNNSELVFKKIKKHLIDYKGKQKYIVRTDHRSDILILAEDEYKKGKNELSVSLYATFIEHTLNKIIHFECEEKNLGVKTTTEIIRSVNILGKCTWLLKLLGLPPIKTEYVNIIKQLSEERNSFFHYKWKPNTDFDEIHDNIQEKKKKQEEFRRIKAVIKYLKHYEAKQVFQGQKAKIFKAVSLKVQKKK